MNINLLYQATEDAYERYSSSLQEIDNIKRDISNNRKGKISLSDIPQDPTRMRKRMEREGDLMAGKALERINGTADFQDICIIKKIARMGDAICRIEIPMPFGNTAYGTGFLISPNVIITNHHVFETAESAINATIKFRYELDENSRPSNDVTYRLRPDKFFLTSNVNKVLDIPFSGLDFSLVAVEDISEEGTPISEFSYIKMDGGQGKILEGENCVVIQHPQGDYKKIVLKDIRLLTLNNEFLIYESDTLPGSSGSMVLGLGTGEVVGLHHSGVPRKNAAGDWLRKDGGLVEDDDSDADIDWIGNEGIRVSSILNAIAGVYVEPDMQIKRDELLQCHIMPTQSALQVRESNKYNIPSHPPISTIMKESAPINPSVQTAAQVQHFEILVSDREPMFRSWEEDIEILIPGMISSECLFPFSTDEKLRRYYYISIHSDIDPWKQAAVIEELPQVIQCVPDLPAKTHMEPRTGRVSTESRIVSKDDTDDNNWREFTENWKSSHWCESSISGNLISEYRRWNHAAIRSDEKLITTAIEKELNNLKLVQLDTGYTNHTKNMGGYDLERDYDSIDNDSDAKDRQSGRIGRMPDHGTRTASLVIGSKLQQTSPNAWDGNTGILTKGGKPVVKVIPYRVSNSVILIGRGRDMVDGARRAIENGADVMFMCMGSYPRPMMEAIAKDAYDKGVIWVCAAGNEVKVVIAPAMYPGTIAVAAVNPDFRPWSGSSRGPEVDVAAPGESVYVPVFGEGEKESMRFGNGTSYATPHVAAAAMLWKAANADKIRELYKEPWQIVEAFRYCLQNSAQPFPDKWSDWQKDNYGRGLLDLEALLKVALPASNVLNYAYKGFDTGTWDLGVIEAVSKIWDSLWLNVTGQEAALAQPLTQRGQAAVAALTGTPRAGALEAAVTTLSNEAKEKVLRTYFESFSNPIKYEIVTVASDVARS